MTVSSRPATGVRSSRVAAIVLLLFSFAYGIAGSQIDYAFSSDPLGPRVFPVVLAALLAVFAILYFFFPGAAEPWPQGALLRRSILLPALILVSAVTLEPLGFGVAMFLLIAGVARIFGASVKAALIGGVLQASFWYFIFIYLLEVYLPRGDLLQLVFGK